METPWKLMPREEEARLAALVRRGDHEALALLVEAHLRFVHTVARRYQHCGLPLEDLVAEGCVGIIQAAKRFDPAQGTRFVTYAVWWIRKAILLALGGQSRLVRLPEGAIKRIREHHRSVPSPSRGWTAAPVRGSRTFHPPAAHDGLTWARELSLTEAGAAGTDTRKPLDWLSAQDPNAEQELISADRASKLHQALDRLTSQEREVLALRFGLNDGPVLTLRELGRRMALSNEGVRQIEMQARKRLAHLLRTAEGGRKNLAAASGAPAQPVRPGRGSGRSRRAGSAPGI